MVQKLLTKVFALILLNSYYSYGQSFNCDQFRKVMDEEMDAMNFNHNDRKYIIGLKEEYYLVGMSDYFTSVPVVPKYIYESENINPHMVKIIVAHVDLYHCDLVEKEITKNSSAIKVENEVEVKIFPNPTSGILNIKSKYKINSIVVFNTSGALTQKIEKVEEQINLSKLTKGIYYLQISTESGKIIKKVILE